MQIVLHEMSKPAFWGKIRKMFRLLKNLPSMLRVKRHQSGSFSFRLSKAALSLIVRLRSI